MASAKNDSPFKKYFNPKWENCIIKTSQTCGQEENTFYCPSLLKIIYDLLHIIPLWTGMMLKQFQNVYPQFQMPSRVTNNSVESNFNILKNSLLGKTKKMPSEFAFLSYTRIQAKYFQFYEALNIHVNKNPEKTEYETWKPRKKKRKSMTDSFYFLDIENFGFETKKFRNNCVNKIDCKKLFSIDKNNFVAKLSSCNEELNISSSELSDSDDMENKSTFSRAGMIKIISTFK